MGIIKYIDLFKERKFEQSVYCSPEVDIIYMRVDHILCMSFTDGSGNGGNTGDDLEPGDDWGGMLS